MLGLVLGHHLEDEAPVGQAVLGVGQVARRQGVERPLPNPAQVVVGGRLIQDRGVPASRAGRLGRVVDVLELGVERRQPREPTGQPQLLVGRDMTEISKFIEFVTNYDPALTP